MWDITTSYLSVVRLRCPDYQHQEYWTQNKLQDSSGLLVVGWSLVVCQLFIEDYVAAMETCTVRCTFIPALGQTWLAGETNEKRRFVLSWSRSKSCKERMTKITTKYNLHSTQVSEVPNLVSSSSFLETMGKWMRFFVPLIWVENQLR